MFAKFFRLFALLVLALSLFGCAGVGVAPTAAPQATVPASAPAAASTPDVAAVASTAAAQAVKDYEAAHPTATIAPTAETVALTSTAVPTAESAPANQISEGKWEEVDFHPTGDRQDVVNINHNGKNSVTISWFWAAAGTTPPAEGCTAHVTSAKDGERVTMKGAFRTWTWTGSEAPTKAQIQALVSDWVKVLQAEPRGSCPVYKISWQDASLKP